jgi:hypothetical protein
MVTESLSCPYCGKFFQVGIPTVNEVTQIKNKSFWNMFSDSTHGSRMVTKCEHCEGSISI